MLESEVCGKRSTHGPAEYDEKPTLLTLGYGLAHRAVDAAMVDTRDPEHMRADIRMVEVAARELERRFDGLGGRWPPET
jgi:hypothetical protein